MPRNGSGTYTRPQPDYVSGTTILASSVNSDLNDMASALTGSLARDGQAVPTANLPMGGFRITGLANAIADTDAATLAQVNVALAQANAAKRNLIINGNPVINQRVYVSGTATAGANQYTLDRWRVVTSGQSVSWTDNAGIRTVTAPAGGMEQVIEALNNLGGVHTLSWTGTATATVNGASVANGGQVTLTGGSDVTLRMSNGTWSQVQLEPGSVATPFERRQYGQELALCQRYYQKSYEQGTAPGTATRSNLIVAFQASGAANYAGGFNLKQTMRAAPSISYWDGAGNASRISYYATSWNDNNNWLTFLNISSDAVIATASVAVTSSAFIHYAASAEF